MSRLEELQESYFWMSLVTMYGFYAVFVSGLFFTACGYVFKQVKKYVDARVGDNAKVCPFMETRPYKLLRSVCPSGDYRVEDESPLKKYYPVDTEFLLEKYCPAFRRSVVEDVCQCTGCKCPCKTKKRCPLGKSRFRTSKRTKCVDPTVLYTDFASMKDENLENNIRQDNALEQE